MKLQLINDVNTLKSTDNATAIELAVVDEQQQFIDLAQFKMIVVNIGTGGTLYSSETPIVDADTNTFSFTLSNALPVGTYQVQVHLTTDDGKLHIAPNRGSETLTIEKSFNEVGETIVVMTIQQLLDDMAATLEIAEAANTKSDSAVIKANTAVSTANTAKSTADTAKSTADTAKTTATNAVTTANTANTTASDAKTIAQQANTTASSANTKSENAVSTANSANATAQSANTKADNAVSTANTAKTTADKVRADFDTLTKDDTNMEVINARTTADGATYSTLKERLDAMSASLPKVYGIKIDTTNSNPATALTYIDDATSFTPARMNFTTDTFDYGSWADKYPFNEIKPCLFKDGTVVGYLNPNDYNKFVDGSDADITSGDSGDVMVEFPRIYWKFETIGTDLYIRYSKEKVDDDYKCLAHMRGDTVKDKCYVSAYLGTEVSSKLRSLSGKTPTASKTIGAFRTLAQANGSNYDQMAYYQLLMLQVLYIVMFKDRDSQSALGQGYTDSSNTASTTTGQLNNKGLFYGEATGKVQAKFCGIEDWYGNLRYWIDGLYNQGRFLLISNHSFNNKGENYKNFGEFSSGTITSGYINKIQATTDTGFIAKKTDGTQTTYYTDVAYVNINSLPIFGGTWSAASTAGAFQLNISSVETYTWVSCGARLMCC